MHQRKLMNQQMEKSGLRLGDGCKILPFYGKKKELTLNRTKLDIVSEKYRPDAIAMSYIELPNSGIGPFHYRLEIDESKMGRFFLRTLEGDPFWLNGILVKEAYLEREDRLFIDDNKLIFSSHGLQGIIAKSFEHPFLKETRILESNLKILIEGETGTGKTHLAEKIHQASGRKGNFISVNLSSYNPNLIESELFGHKKGSFTGAVKDKRGAFEAAQHGTLFLDEVDSLPIDLQTKLLTFLDDNRYRQVGDTLEKEIKTRIIFASGRPLENLVGQGLFRKDFYFRLKSGHTIKLSSLRNEPQRIEKICHEFSLRNGVTFTRGLLDFYQTLVWPGNLRQLFGHLEKKMIFGRSTKLDFDDLDEELIHQSSNLESFSVPFELVPLKELKNDYVKKAIALCEGNISLTARKLQITEKTVRSLLKGA